MSIMKIEIPGAEYTGTLEYVRLVNNKTQIIQLPIFEPTEDFQKKHPNFLFDKRSGNLHLHPENMKFAVECSRKIDEKLSDIRDALNNVLDKNKYKIRRVKARMYNEHTGYQNATHLFDYISVSNGKNVFQILGVRYNKQEKNIVEQLCSMQFYATGVNYGSIDLFPVVSKSLAEHSKKYVYSDTKCLFYDEPEVICKEFVDFMKCTNL